MPEIFPVQSSSIDALLRRLEVRLVTPRAPLWELSNVIQPVSLVDSGITLRADVEANPFLFATEGELSAPVAGVLMADTGQLPAGNYQFKAWVSTYEPPASKGAVIEHRNAANDGNNWSMLMAANRESPGNVEWTESLLVNERVRLIIDQNTGASILWQGFIWRRLIVS